MVFSHVRSYLWSQSVVSVCCVAPGALFFATETAGRCYRSSSSSSGGVKRKILSCLNRRIHSHSLWDLISRASEAQLKVLTPRLPNSDSARVAHLSQLSLSWLWGKDTFPKKRVWRYCSPLKLTRLLIRQSILSGLQELWGETQQKMLRSIQLPTQKNWAVAKKNGIKLGNYWLEIHASSLSSDLPTWWQRQQQSTAAVSVKIGL